MASSRDEVRPVEPDPASPPKTRATKSHQGVDVRPRYSPVILVVDVVRLLRDRGVGASRAVDQLHETIEASTQLLQRLGVEPDKRISSTPVEHTPETHAAAVLMRAAGIEPSTVAVWPGRPA